ncbi:flagellar hook-associated protein FlgK [Pseudoruegeria sp. SK021]|uniref:flagellar hook-associated protein FlgK n=1 Tax=Pseudoruegeria sp. SK021 TaxID=1933035 RepID=UPI000A25C5B9|nr:flagellar hook-associated protein FlgK [Pseudoruegeria sp. SK021]OSP54664.1 flagellar hook-associated protein FlgK [Pseudoruegeria sp. SK021]
MTIAGAMSNALSGLTAVSRSASVISSNVSNALTDTYGRREVVLSSRVTGAGGGVDVVTVRRVVDQIVLADRRAADADLGRASTQADSLTAILSLVGEPGSGQSLADRISDLESALVSAASRPDSETRLTQAFAALDGLATHIGGISNGIQVERSRADQGIATTVQDLNGWLSRIEDLNVKIQRQSIGSTPPNGLLDERQKLVDLVSEQVPVREIDRGNGVIALMTQGGMLLDGPAPVLGFTATATITPYHSLSGGTLSGLTLDGQPVDMTRSPGPLSGGRLDGLFAVRDTVAPEIGQQLDAIARDLVERFETPGVDPTLLPGAAGLLTDGGSAFLVSNELGLASRLSVNTLVDPDAGGYVWRLRDGLGATAPGDEGQSAGLSRLSDALTMTRTPLSGGFMASAHSAAGLSSNFQSNVGVTVDLMVGDATYARIRSDAMTERTLADGVDTDREMQKLLMIEQAYAANSRVIQAADAMLDTLMRM